MTAPVMPSNTVRIVARPSVFRAGAVYTEMPAGPTLAEMLVGVPGPLPPAPGFAVLLDGVRVPTAWLHRIRPKPGRHIAVCATLHDSGGGEGGKDTLRTVAIIAIIAAAIVAGPYVGAALSIGAALGTSLVGTAGMLALNALAPPRTNSPAALQQASGDALEQSPNYSIEGARNRLLPFGVVPQVLGRHRMVPPLGARQYTELLGDTQYLRATVTWSHGPARISDLRIGDTPIGNFPGIEVETREGRPGDAPLTLFPGQVDEQSLSIPLTQAAGFSTRTTEPDADEFSVDVTFPGGLLEFDQASGRRLTRNVVVEIQRAVAGSGAFGTAGTIDVTAASPEVLRRGFRYVLPSRGQWDVRLRRLTADSTVDRIVDDVVWTAMRSIRNEDPIQYDKPLAKTAIRLRASNSLNGVIEDLNAIVEVECLDWTGSAWAAAYTRNPASLFRYVLQGAAGARPKSDAEIDLEALQDWHDFCAARNFTFDMVCDFEASQREILDDIAAAGRATVAFPDGRWSVVIDRAQTVPVQLLTPYNSWGFESEKTFPELPHGYRMRFVNAQADLFRQDERIVYDDGYDENNATLIEGLDAPGVTDPDQVFKLGREHIASARLQPERHTLFVDIEHLVATRGDLVRINHDVLLAGLAFGRVKAVTGDGGAPEQAVSVTLDQSCPMAEGTSYAIRVRKADGTQRLDPVVTVAGEHFTLTYETPFDLADAPGAGDLFGFGQLGLETVEQLITNIEPGGDLSARLSLVDYAPAIYDAGAGAIPPFDSKITLPPETGRRPAAPAIREVQSDLTVAVRADDGSIQERIVISSNKPELFDPNEVILEGQVRAEGADDYGSSHSQVLADRVTIPDVIGGEVYDLRIRRVATAATDVPGAASDWREQLAYTVIGKTAPPPDVFDLRLEGSSAVWNLDEPLDYKGHRIRFHRGNRISWSDASPAHEGLVSATFFDLSELRGGTFTLLVKAVDTGLRESVNAKALIVDLGDPILDNVILEIPYREFDYGVLDNRGTVTGGALEEGELRATDTVLFWNPNNDAPFWDKPNDALFWTSDFAEMTYETFFVADEDTFGARLSLALTLQASSHAVNWRSAGDALLWTEDAAPLWTDDGALLWAPLPAWRAWPGSVPVTTRERIYFQVITAAGAVRGIISEFTVLMDVIDVLERFNDVTIAAGGTRLPITREFAAILNIQLTLQDDGGQAVTARTVDKDTELGPLIEALTIAGLSTTASIDAVVQGY